MKHHCKQPECKWKLSQDTADKDTFKSALGLYHHQIRNTKRTALADRIDAGTNSSKEIFAIIKEFTAPAAASSSITDSQDLCNMLSELFCNKITSI